MTVRQKLSRSILSFASFGSLLFIAACDPANKPADANVNFSAPQKASASRLADDMPPPPKDAQYTLFCRDFPDPAHVQEARDAQNLLRQSTDLKKWYIVHAADHSTLYYGFYRCIDPRDPKDGDEGKRAITDLNTIRQMQDSEGNRLFSASLPVPIDAPDPEANPAWDITRTNGTWSIEVASYSNTADRKQNAVDSVRAARAQGIEAYYYHGATVSSVCIGSWPAEAAVEVTPEAQNVNPDVPLVVTPQPLTPNVADPLKGMGIQAISPHIEYVDPTLDQAMHKWTEHATNGETHVLIDPVTHEQTTQVEKPFLFKIPHPDPLDFMAAGQTAAGKNPPSPGVAPTGQTKPPAGVGQLPSLGD